MRIPMYLNNLERRHGRVYFKVVPPGIRRSTKPNAATKDRPAFYVKRFCFEFYDIVDRTPHLKINSASAYGVPIQSGGIVTQQTPPREGGNDDASN